MTRSLLFSLLLLPALALAAPASTPAPVRRFALLVGVNDGGPGRARLRYAVTDATAFGQVLEELGGVQPQDRMMLMEGGRPEFERALAGFKDMLASARKAGGRTEALIYYSGHSDEEGLLLQKDKFGYRELRQALESLPADVRIAILDSCASGTLARQKGGVRRPAFLSDASTAVRGHAILTSSSEDEVSQESDRIGGSFFTHNLVSGLRGAADATGDGRVTLHEAYQFAFHETLARTEQTRSGAQHPAYDIELAGTGELVMTDLRSTAAVLVLGEMLDGRLYVRDAPGRLVVELKKFAGRTTELGLQPGRYTVVREAHGEAFQTELVLDKGGRAVLAASAFRPVGMEMTAMRGKGTPQPTGLAPTAVGGAVAPPADTSSRRYLPINLALFPTVQTNDIVGGDVDNSFSFALGAGRGARLHGAAVALGANMNTGEVEGLQLAVGGNVASAELVGAQFSVGGNWATGPANGVQASVGLNVLRQGGTVGQLAVGGNLSTESMGGTQLSAGTNWAAKDFSGVQGTVGFNMVRGHMSGVQMSAGANYASTADGVQLSLINVGGDVEGMQLGIVNVARKMSGLQLGLVNVTEEMESGVPIGLLSLVRNGQFHVELYGSDVNFANAAIKVGSRHFYTTVVAGMGRHGDVRGPSHWTLGLGLGGHIPVTERLFVDVDAVTSNIYPWDKSFEGDRLLHQLRVMGGYRFGKNLTVIGGPSFNLMHSVDDVEVTGISELSRQGPRKFFMWPGVQLGLRI
ncbi:caspase family protein [Pyxidicoccus fallax]|uniref:Caspase family protein n=1 Tax=Pyxidicoccus fallax TaxID=394095 RepID=A0A848LJ61_9BACT|nr:caspase family protein [Pyxidicoccus fallax]NMO17759.1 caspase family protein [Pyxidicoccus fallax]NPC78218.1 caspase family protein [Pyxidicoccus fallax]